MHQLIEDYNRKIDVIHDLLQKAPNNCPDSPRNVRLKTKQACYRTFVTELEREVKFQNQLAKD
jgi:hypothetical protein